MKKVIPPIVLLFMLMSCSWPLSVGGEKKVLTPKAQAVLFINTYKAEIADLQSMSKMTNTTPQQKRVFKEKQRILGQMKPLLDIFIAVADANGTPDASVHESLNDLVNQLTALLVGGVK